MLIGGIGFGLQQLIVNFSNLFKIQPLDSPKPERLNIYFHY
jgi:hypothetical protein